MLIQLLCNLLARSTFLRYRIAPALVYVVFVRIMAYRKKTIERNISAAYPDKSALQRNDVIKRFYRNLSVLIPEALAVHEMTAAEIKTRVKLKGMEQLDTYLDAGKNVLLVTGHYHNWEMCGQAMVLRYPTNMHTLYMPLKNEKMDRYFKERRQRFGIEAIPAGQAKTRLPEVLKKSKGHLIAFIGDQSPNPQRAHWVRFLNQNTGFFKGFEQYANAYGLPVFFLDIEQPKTGYYILEAKQLCENAALLKEGEAVCNFARTLEEKINKQPEFWLWSHNRWKHPMPKEAKLLECP